MKRIAIILPLFVANGMLPAVAQRHQLDTTKWSWNSLTEKIQRYERGNAGGFSTETQKQLYNRMKQVMELFHQTPLLNPGKGFQVSMYGTICEDGCGSKRAILGHSGILFKRHLRNAAGESWIDAEGPSIRLYYNDITRILSHLPVGTEKFYPEILSTKTLRGYPVYGDLVVLTKSRKPLFKPVSHEDFIKEDIRRQELDLVEIRKKGVTSNYSEWLKSKNETIKATLTGLSYLEKQDPAKAKAEKEKFLKNMASQDSMLKADDARAMAEQRAFIKTFEDRLAATKSKLAGMSAKEKATDYVNEDGRRLVVPNPEFFNPAHPTHSIQLLVIDFNQRAWRDEKDDYSKLLRSVKNEMDLDGLMRLIAE